MTKDEARKAALEAYVKAASDPQDHRYGTLELDDAKAAHEYRLAQAEALIRRAREGK